MTKKAVAKTPVKIPAPVASRQKPSVLLDTRVIYYGYNPEQLARILKKTGGFYYHRDWHASHYVKVMLDQILEN